MVFDPMICFWVVLLRKTIIDFVLSNVFEGASKDQFVPMLMFAFSIFGSEGLYVTKKGIFFAWIGLEVLKSDLLSRLSTMLICLLILAYL